MKPTDPKPSGFPRMLVVDDAALSRKLHESYGLASGFLVDTARNGLEAIEAVGTAQYQCILTDIEMPVMDGLTATRRIRALEAESGSVPAIIVAVTGAESVEACNAAGVNHFVSKLDYPKLQELLAILARSWQ